MELKTNWWNNLFILKSDFTDIYVLSHPSFFLLCISRTMGNGCSDLLKMKYNMYGKNRHSLNPHKQDFL